MLTSYSLEEKESKDLIFALIDYQTRDLITGQSIKLQILSPSFSLPSFFYRCLEESRYNHT